MSWRDHFRCLYVGVLISLFAIVVFGICAVIAWFSPLIFIAMCGLAMSYIFGLSVFVSGRK